MALIENGCEERMPNMNIIASWFQSIWIFLGSMLFILILVWILFKILQAQSRNKNDKD